MITSLVNGGGHCEFKEVASAVAARECKWELKNKDTQSDSVACIAPGLRELARSCPLGAQS